jgi:hypothetical protein
LSAYRVANNAMVVPQLGSPLLPGCGTRRRVSNGLAQPFTPWFNGRTCPVLKKIDSRARPGLLRFPMGGSELKESPHAGEIMA